MRIDVNSVEMHTLPVLPVRGVISLPNTEVRLEIGRPQSIEALEACEANGNYVVLVSQVDPNVETPQSDDLFQYGTIAKITMKIKLNFMLIKSAITSEPRINTGARIITLKTEPIPI